MRVPGLRAVSFPFLICLTVGIVVGQVDVPVGESRGGLKLFRRVKRGDRTEIRVESKTIPPKAVYQFSRTVGPGRLVKVSGGVPGNVVRTYAVRYQNGKPAAKELLATKRTESRAALYWMGRSGYTASRHMFSRGRVMRLEATAYDPSAGRGKRATFRTATGLRAKYGVVAVDPRVIPLGTLLFVEGYGFALAADTGRAIKGNKIDLCLNTYRQAMGFGRQTVRVHILR